MGSARIITGPEYYCLHREIEFLREHLENQIYSVTAWVIKRDGQVLFKPEKWK